MMGLNVCAFLILSFYHWNFGTYYDTIPNLGLDVTYVNELRDQRVNQIAVDFIKEKESCRTSAYKDLGGVWTIGYGHTGPEVQEGLQWSSSECEATLARDVEKVEEQVKALVKVPLNDNQMAALISFAYNLGVGALKRSELLSIINRADYLHASTGFMNWASVDGRRVKGLVKRRLEEALLFLDY